MIAGDPQRDAEKELDLERVVAGFKAWVEKHQHDRRATFTLEVRDGFFGVRSETVAWYEQKGDAG